MASPPTDLTDSRILEINLISAENLAPISKNMKTYAVAWFQPDRKHATGVDQVDGTNPTWNDKFMFRVDDKFLNSEDATIFVEIYAAAWEKDALVGCVNVPIKDIFHLPSVANANSAPRTVVTLQIRRPSGRFQGVLNMELALSLPQLEDPKPIKTTITSPKKESHDTNEPQNDKLTMEDHNSEKRPDKGSIVIGGSCVNGSVVKGNGSMVNGSSLCSSDVGPSASVVAAAIATGLYKPPVHHQTPSKESLKIKEWTKKERQKDHQLERWPSDNPTPHTSVVAAAVGHRKKSSTQRTSKGKKTKSDGTKLFSCFSTAMGCEISVTCGGEGRKKYRKKHENGSHKICNLSSVNDNYSQ